VVGIDLRSSRYFSLNPTATFLWKLLGDGAAPDDLTERLSAEFALDRGLAAEDVSAFLASLEAGQAVSHTLAAGRKAYVQVLSGRMLLDGQPLEAGDGARIQDQGEIRIEGAAEVLLFDLP